MIHYPLSFPVRVRHAKGTQLPWSSHVSAASPKGLLACAIPSEFDGPGGGFSPEDFFALAIANCFTATFQVIAEKSGVRFRDMSVDGSLIVDRDDAGSPWMKSIVLAVQVDAGEADQTRVRHLLEKTAQSCIVMRSIKTEVRFEFTVR
jgi:organic hydroperoxide reductase OsmC/OhrA